MKNLRSLLIVLIAVAAVVLFIGTKNVYASSGIVLTPSTLNTTNTANTTTNTTRNTVNTTNTTNLVNTTTNNINSGVTKDLPKTGETDTYIIAGIGAIALVIGTVAFIKSKNM